MHSSEADRFRLPAALRAHPRCSFQPKRLSAAKPTDSDVPPKLLEELLESVPRVTLRRISTVTVAGYAVNRGSWKRTGLPNQDIGPLRQFSCPLTTRSGGSGRLLLGRSSRAIYEDTA